MPQCATQREGSPGVQSGVESADAAGVLVGCLLFFDVLPQDVNRRTATARSKIRRRPQYAPTLQPRMEVPELLAQQPRRYTLERSNQIRQRHLRRVVDQKMHMIVLSVELYQLRVEILADVGKDDLHGIQMLFLEHIASILSNKDQMCVKRKNTMPTMPQIAVCFARPCHNSTLL